jgi:hypothetical protein
MYGKQVLAIENNNLYLLGDGFTKTDNSFIDEFNLKNQQTKRLYLTYKDKRDLLSIEISKGKRFYSI